MTSFGRSRRALWHLRQNGINGLVTHLRRHSGRAPLRLEQKSSAPPADSASMAPAPPAEAEASRPPAVPAWLPPVPETPRRPHAVAGLVAPEWFSRLLTPELTIRPISPDASAASRIHGVDFLLIAHSRLRDADIVEKLTKLAHTAREQRIPTVLWDITGELGLSSAPDTPEAGHSAGESDGSATGADALIAAADVAYTVHTSPVRGVTHLPLGVQPHLHNPVRTPSARHSHDIVLVTADETHADEADSLMAPGRGDDADHSPLSMLVEAVVDVLPRLPEGFDVFTPDSTALQKQLPADAPGAGQGSVRIRTAPTPEVRDALMRRYAVGIDSGADIATVCSRDLLDYTACGTAALTAPGPGPDGIFAPDELLRIESRPEAGFAARALTRSAELRDRMVHRAQRRLWQEHTYSHRVDSLLRSVGLEQHVSASPRPVTTALVSTIRPHLVAQVIRMLGAQAEADVQVALLAHGWEPKRRELAALAADAGVADIVILEEPRETPLGACLNRLTHAADGAVVAKIDDDDCYGPCYLSDALHALEYSRAQVVGKQAHFVHVESHNLTALRFPEREHRYTQFVIGPTIVTARETVLAHPFPEVAIGEDSAFLRSVAAADGMIYSADRFNFALRRTNSSHTWQAADAEVLANADVQTGGFDFEHVFV